MNSRSLRFRLLIWHAGLLAAVFLLFGVAAYQLLRHCLEQSLAASLRRRTGQIAVSLLAIVKSICGAHGAKVEVKSVESRGSTFTVELPLAPP